jgi:hypothetical protein
MFEFEKQRGYIAWHIDGTAAGYVVPLNVHACKFSAGHVELHAMEFLEDTEEVVKVFKAHIFNSKVIYNETELDGSPFVVPETGC